MGHIGCEKIAMNGVEEGTTEARKLDNIKVIPYTSGNYMLLAKK